MVFAVIFLHIFLAEFIRIDRVTLLQVMLVPVDREVYMEDFGVYRDIKNRTNGEIYVGVVGPVRTGKSTFIKRFMEKMVIPNIQDENAKELATDEMPQSASGKTIMTTEPKFIPKDGVDICISDDICMRVRLIDCVGYVVDSAEGQTEDGKERMVKTPWFEYDIPFTKAAEIGTKKVINNHSTVGIVVTCDGSFGDIKRDDYINAEQKTINELSAIGKPFVIVLNTSRPSSPAVIELARQMEKTYGRPVIPVNCDQLKNKDIEEIFEALLMSFPITAIRFSIPKWLEAAENDNSIKASVIEDSANIMEQISCIRDVKKMNYPENIYVESYNCHKLNLSDGSVDMDVNIYDKYYYEMLTDMTGTEIHNEYDFIKEIKNMAETKKYCKSVMNALNSVRSGGYGFFMPDRSEILLDNPELIKAGNKYGVKIKASAPSIHMIKANITTEIAPIVGSKEQAEDLVTYINDSTKEDGSDIWNVNIFGKSIEQLVDEGLSNKANKINAQSQVKLQDTMEKIVNDSNGGLVCIII
jgi:stage IV sporulation protein A